MTYTPQADNVAVNGNRLYRDNMISELDAFAGLSHANGEPAGYDGLNQLTEFRRGQLSDSGTDSVPDTVASASRWQNWTLDGMGNWDAVTSDIGTDDRNHDQQNQITSISGQTTPGYDANGNTTGDETGKTLTYDAWNRLVAVSGSPGVTHGYDALGRRIKETRSTTTDLYYSDGWQVLETLNSSVKTQFVWSPGYVDSMVLRDRDTDANGSFDQRLYVQQDANWNVTSLVDGTTGSSTFGQVVERYVYDPYGAVTYLDASWGTLSASAYGMVYLHQGGRYDSTGGLYHFRNRELSPTLGRWMQNDPIGYSAGDTNLYRDVGNSPTNHADPHGLRHRPPPQNPFVRCDPVVRYPGHVPTTPPPGTMPSIADRQAQQEYLDLLDIARLADIPEWEIQDAIRGPWLVAPGERSPAVRNLRSLIARHDKAKAKAKNPAKALNLPQEPRKKHPCQDVPIFTESLSGPRPKTAKHISIAQSVKGKPFLLHRETDAAQIAANRYAAIATSGVPTPEYGFARDEYPFATTKEGGAGASVQIVPAPEQHSQGGALNAFYVQRRISENGAFCVFAVP